MRLVADSGLWTTGRADVTEEPPLVALLEVSGAVLSWTLNDPDDAPPRLTFTDVSRADWLWRVLGEAGHVALLSAVRDAAVPAGGIPLRRLATGHWLRRWWPASRQDGIAGLDRALLDAELALLTAGAQHFFPDDTLDSDVAGLLAPHATALLGHLVSPDPRVADLPTASAWTPGVGRNCLPRLMIRVWSWRRGAGPRAAAIARGVASVAWSGVPPGVFDAAEDTVGWSIRVDGSAVVAVVQADVIGPDPATGIAVRLRSAAVEGAGALDAAGRATFPLTGARH